MPSRSTSGRRISEAVPFWNAEPGHRDYLQPDPNGYTFHFPGRAGSCHTAKLPPNRGDQKPERPRAADTSCIG